MRHTSLVGRAFMVFIVAMTAAAGPAGQTPVPEKPQVPAIRTGITMVPIDVRVLDREGKPVTDLKQEDFIVLEDNVRQKIEHFSATGLTPETPTPGARPQFRRPNDPETAPRNQRIFLLVLGRGRLQAPTKGMDALIGLVRERLLPQDQVAVLAYNRAPDFTTDRAKILRVLERFKRANNSLESKLASHFSGLQANYGSRKIPDSIQKDIEGVFNDAEGPANRELPTGTNLEGQKIAVDTRRTADDLLRAETVRDRENVINEVGLISEFTEVTFDEYVFQRAQTDMDLTSIYSGIEYMRYLQGEKHLVLLSERGLYLPRTEYDNSIAAVASDARVVIDTIHTGGTANPPSPYSVSPTRPFQGMRTPAPVPPPTTRFIDNNAAQSMANVSRLTGGISSRYTYADTAMRRIDDATRFQYLLAYMPANTNWNGRFRRIVVRVNRPGLTVLYRHGYFGRSQLVPFDRRQFMTYNRIVSAGNHEGPIRDIPLTLKVTPLAPTDTGEGQLQLDLTIDVSQIAFTRVEDRHTASLELAFFCGDPRQTVVGELWQKTDLKLRDETYQRSLKDGYVHTATVTIGAPPKYVKAVVYDPNGDVVGSAIVEVKKP
jgi:VWFA-related protein